MKPPSPKVPEAGRIRSLLQRHDLRSIVITDAGRAAVAPKRKR